MFTEEMLAIIGKAKGVSASTGQKCLVLESLLAALAWHPESRAFLVYALGVPAHRLDELAGQTEAAEPHPDLMPLARETRELLENARKLAEREPDLFRPGLIGTRHVACSAVTSQEACEILGMPPLAATEVTQPLSQWHDKDARPVALEQLLGRLRTMREMLLDKIFGQGHAVEAFVEGLFNAEVVATADTKRRAPRSLFIFAGPPGVGKTLLAEVAAGYLERPFKRFDMSAYASAHLSDALTGMPKSFQGAHPGVLTHFVEEHPEAVLLFDEIEKAHETTILLFLQLLDAGVLEDKFHNRNVVFRDTTIIFTTNAGRKLYDNPNQSGVHRANASFHRQTLLNALETEVKPQTREPFFPAAICSRMATGYPILFNHLGVAELERVARAELERVAALVECQYYRRITFDALLPLCLVLREGVRTDARTLCAQSAIFLKNELFKLCQLFKTENLGEALAKVHRIHIEVEDERKSLPPEAEAVFGAAAPARILIVAAPSIANLYATHVSTAHWSIAATRPEALSMLAETEIDFVLLDLWFNRSPATPTATLEFFDHTPAAARALAEGQELLRHMRERFPELPVYLLSFPDMTAAEGTDGGAVEQELFLACVRAGGARGVVAADFLSDRVPDWETRRDRFAREIAAIAECLVREKAAERLGAEHKAVMFETAPRFCTEAQAVAIRLRNFRLTRAIEAGDVGEVLDDVDRPKTSFADVIGAQRAKEELQFFVDFLRAPRRFKALGLQPPKGVLLYGPPGTGKTMLARAMAGESNVSFIAASASSFVTMWQGSGPQNIRDLFARARRYAPVVLFIDEIDAIGRVRKGGATAHGEEMALNALLTEMDGFVGPSGDRPVFILAATNFRVEADNPDAPDLSSRTLDPALVRRFSSTVLVDLPSTAERRIFLVSRVGKLGEHRVNDTDFDLLAEKSVGMSIANLEQIVESSTRTALKRGVQLDGAILIEALDTAAEGEVKEWAPEFLERTARHEAGHTILYWASGWVPPEVSIIARGHHGGGMRRSEVDLSRELRTRGELLGQVRTSLGGRAAEIVFYGESDGVSTGASGDLVHATKIVQSMLCQYGMDDEYGLIAAPEMMDRSTGSLLCESFRAKIDTILRREMEEAKRILRANREHLDAVSGALIQKNRLTRDDLEQLLGAAEPSR